MLLLQEEQRLRRATVMQDNAADRRPLVYGGGYEEIAIADRLRSVVVDHYVWLC